ncbi:MAG: DnaJ domain-containing protein [Chloroflexota bacterium]
MPSDPYRVLGLNPGASAADVKRAYRALAKANHPDSAGERALPRFLAIQAAYEQLSTQKGRGATRGSRSGPAAEPWKAEPSRAREARRGSRPAGAGAGPSSTGGGSASERASGGPTRRRTGPAGNSGGGAPPGGPRRRAGRKATFGSTSYDGPHDASDPAWQGAAWYGQSSGEYWTVNPREYADPRKHGPEYQARAADRAARAEGARTRPADTQPGATAGTDSDTGAYATPESNPRREARPDASGTRACTYARERAEAATRARSTAGPGEEPGASRGPGGPATDASADPFPLGMDFIPSLDLSALERSSFRRVLFALLAWPPLGIAAAALIGESTGCAAFSASCTREGAILPWLAQVAILLVLLAVPPVARVLIGGTAAVLLVAFPAAATLSAGGARYDKAYGPASLLAILAVAWIIGVAVMAIRAGRKRSAA